MRYAEHAPCDALRRHVVCHWTIDAAAGAHRVLPDGCMDILFELGPHGAHAQVVGTMTRAIVAGTSSGTSLLGVRFRPGAALALGCSAREARDGSFVLGDVWGAIAREMEGRVAEAPTIAAAIRVVEREILVRVARARSPDPRVAHIVRSIEGSGGAARVASLARDARIGERQLERLFDEHVGIGPKTFARVVRVQRVAAEIAALHEARKKPQWAAIAHDVGYADQAHMIREVRALAGVTPAVLAAERTMSDPFNPSTGALATVDV